jgi:dipeptidase E
MSPRRKEPASKSAESHSSAPTRHIVALGGGGFLMEPDNPLLDDFILNLARKRQPRVCFVPTATGDNDNFVARFYRAFDSARCLPSDLPLFNRHLPDLRKFLCDQDVIYVGGGNTANMLAVWRVHEMDKALTAAWRSGVVLCGVSAGAMCWFEGGITDSFGSQLSPLRDGLGLLKGAFCPHYDGEPGRRPALHHELSRGFMATLAADDGVGLHFIGKRLDAAVSSRQQARAYHVRVVNGKVSEAEVPTRYLGSRVRAELRKELREI